MRFTRITYQTSKSANCRWIKIAATGADGALETFE
jgi:hypothetical protein